MNKKELDNNDNILKKELSNKTKKPSKQLVSFCITSIIVLGLIIAFYYSAQTLPIQSNEIELGDTVKITKEALLDTNKIDKEILDDIRISSILMTNEDKYSYDEETGVVTTKDENYLKAGTYTITFTYGDKSEDVEITVKDTKKPKFIGFKDTITVEQNAEGFDLSKYYLAEDKSDVHVKSEKKTDISKATTTKNTIVGTDQFDNAIKKECMVKIVTQEQIKNGTKLTPMVDGNVPLSKDTLEKAKSGEIDVQVEDLNEDLKETYQNIKDNKVQGTTSYKESENTDAYFNRERFTNEGGISMDELGMTYQEYREFINKNFLDPETGTIKGTYNPETNAMEWTDENGSHSVSMDGVGIHKEELGDSYWDWVESQVGGNNGNSNNNGSGNTGGSSSNPGQPVTPEIPACDDTIPAGFFATKAEADAYGQKLVMDALLNGDANFGGYYVDIYETGCGTKYYGVTLKPFQ